MFRRILIPTDLTDRTLKALEAAGGVLAPDGSQVTLLHVIETIPGIEFGELASFYGGLEKKARARLRDIIDRAPAQRPELTVEIVHGRRAEEIVRFATSHQIDLIVLASHAIDPSQPSQSSRGWGTMSYKVGILAPCPVLLVK